MIKPRVIAGFILVIGLLVAGALLSACRGPEGPAGAPGLAGAAGLIGAPGASEGALSGTVTSNFNKAPVAGAAIKLDPAVKDMAITTDSTGKFSATLPIGAYTLNITKDGFDPGTATASVLGGQTISKDITLNAKTAVVITGTTQTAAPGATVTIKPKITVADGSSITGYKWTQASGVAATLSNDTTDTLSVTLGDSKAYKAAVLKKLVQIDRTMVQAIVPGVTAAAQGAAFKLTVTTSSGTYSASVTVNATLPFVTSSGLQNVPINQPVLVHGKSAAAYAWTLTGPSGSRASLNDGDTQDPYFTPDIAGKYTLKEATTGAALDVNAGTWQGALTGSDAKGLPQSANCTTCHNGKIAPDNFTTWKATGHAGVFTYAQTFDDHYGENCMACHTVGMDTPDAENNGINDQADFAALQATGMLTHPAPDNWKTILAQYPKSAAFTGIQCENCHGPNSSDTTLHPNGTIDPARVSLASEVCGVCHGRPNNHSLFQQWQPSGHGNFELAIDEGTRASCARCHTGQGFLIWIDMPDMTKQLQGAKGNATADELVAMGLSQDKIQPITCAVCHDPHDEGNLVADPPVVKVRIEGDTAMLPSGYKAVAVGKGALCITCHNTRNGLHNDAVGNPANWQAPHAAAQGDVLMGENAYFVATGARSGHANIEDSCATCHIEMTAPPKPYTSAVSHDFAASPAICGECHGAYENGENLIASTEAKIEALGARMSSYLLSKMGDQIHILEYTPHEVQGKSYDGKSNDLTLDKANIASVEPTEPHGQQGFILTLKNPVTVSYPPNTAGVAAHTVSMTTVQFQLADITTDGKAKLIPASDPLVKAGWNYFLVHGDASGGIHNPSFVTDVLNASMAALK